MGEALAAELGEGKSLIHLRLTPARNGQRDGINFAEGYLGLSGAAQQSLG
jgi:hypothetical protein